MKGRQGARLLKPLPIPNGCWESVSMDFMTHLVESKGFNLIMVVVDRMSKMAHFVPTEDTATCTRSSSDVFRACCEAPRNAKEHCVRSRSEVHEQVLARVMEEIGNRNSR